MNFPKFILEKKPLLKLLTQLKSTTKGRDKYAKTLNLDISLTTDLLTLTIPGMQLNLSIIGNGSGKVSMGFLHFLELIKSIKKESFIIQLLNGEVKINDVHVQADVWMYQDDSILRKINLPVNYSHLDLLRLPMMGFTPEELYFNKLSVKVDIAETHLEKDIKEVAKILKKYGFTMKELDVIIKNKVYLRQIESK